MKNDNPHELFPIVDEEGQVVGQASRYNCHNGSKLLHPVVHLHVFNERGELYLQKRPSWKDIQPDKWDTAVGGHVDWGERIEEALQREAYEELGLKQFEARWLFRYVFESEREKELVHSFCTTWQGDVFPSEELAGGRFWRLNDIQQELGKKVFTPNFEQEFDKLLVALSLKT